MRFSGRLGPMEGELGVMNGDSSSLGVPEIRRCLRGESGGEDGEDSCCEREVRLSSPSKTCVHTSFFNKQLITTHLLASVPFLSP